MKECVKCNVPNEVADPETQCLPEHCPRRRAYERYPAEFRIWVNSLTDLYDRMEAGFRVNNDELSLEEWRCLARIRQYYRMDQEAGLAAMMRRVF